MVKSIGKFFFLIFLFLAMLLFFLPKENLYFFAEKELAKKGVVISKEEVKDKGFTFEMHHAHLSVSSIESAVVSDLSLSLYLFYNKLHIDSIYLASSLKSFLPLAIKEVDVVYSIVNPLVVEIETKGDFGKAKGDFSLVDKKLTIILKPSKLMRQKYRGTLRNLKKLKNGEYSYVKSF